uniref:P2X purinoreceptor 7 intracellular domain-containing protein n=1 Tax=Fundulus heteroclitus TaxID=8078 RepID=A0A3Q2QJF5_FUNHE
MGSAPIGDLRCSWERERTVPTPGRKKKAGPRPHDDVDKDKRNTSTEEPPTEQNGLFDLFWCLCGSCNLMMTVVESCCCREIGRNLEKTDNYSQQACIMMIEEVQTICLNDAVLRLALITMCQFYNNEMLPNPAPNRLMQLAAYSSIYGCTTGLVKRNRRVIPSCVVLAIRNKYPSDDGVYLGFKEFDYISSKKCA